MYEDYAEINNSLANCVNGCPTMLSMQILWAIYGSLIFILGIPGNILVILVLQRQALRSNISIFLTAIATLNILVLIISCSNFWLRYVIGFRIRSISYEVCFLHRWTMSFCHSSISWLLVLITVFRFCYVHKSTRFSTELTECRARAIIVMVIICMILVEYAFLRVRNISYDGYVDGSLERCRIDYENFASWARHSNVTFLPFAFILIFTILLSITIKRQAKASVMRLSLDSFRRVQSHLTRMLILTDVQFIITNMPLSIYSSTGFVPFDESLPGSREKKEIWKSCLYAIMFSGFVLNIVIYCFSASRFRIEMKATLLRLFTKEKKNSGTILELNHTDVDAPITYRQNTGTLQTS